MNKRRILVFQHVNNEDLDLIESFLISKNIKIIKVRFFLNEPIPKNLKQFCMMISLGGPMDTWMVKDFPWIIDEKRAIKEFVLDMNRPFLGICLGCQMLGEVLGGKTVRSSKAEIGFFDIKSNCNLKEDHMLSFLPKNFKVFQWHRYEVSELNENIKVIASSKTTKNQIFKYNNAYGIQFHIELDDLTLEKWCKNKEFKNTLHTTYGKNPITYIKKKYSKNLEKMKLICEKFINNLIELK